MKTSQKMGNNEIKPDWFRGTIGVVFTISVMIVLVFYVKYVDIGAWISMENYSDKGEWMKQLGLFIATMTGFSVFIEFSMKEMDRFPPFCRGNNGR